MTRSAAIAARARLIANVYGVARAARFLKRCGIACAAARWILTRD